MRSAPVRKGYKVLKEIKPPLELLIPMEFMKGQCHSHKLHTAPDDANSATCELSTPYFSTGLVEAWLCFCKALERACVGQNATAGPSACAVARRPLEGTACVFVLECSSPPSLASYFTLTVSARSYE